MFFDHEGVYDLAKLSIGTQIFRGAMVRSSAIFELLFSLSQFFLSYFIEIFSSAVFKL